MTMEAWTADYPDPYDFINLLLSGDSLRDANNNNIAYFNDASFNSRMRKAANMSGSPRFCSPLARAPGPAHAGPGARV